MKNELIEFTKMEQRITILPRMYFLNHLCRGLYIGIDIDIDSFIHTHIERSS